MLTLVDPLLIIIAITICVAGIVKTLAPVDDGPARRRA